MKDEAPFSDFPVYAEKSTNKPKAFGIFVCLVLIIAAILGGLYFLGRNQQGSSQNAATPTQVPTSAPEPTATPTPLDLDRAELEVSVLNGSGVVGAANGTAATLRSLGYNVASTGNADKYDYTGITVKVKKDKSDYAELLKKDFAENATGSAVTTSVDDTIPTDAQVIVGK